MSLRDCEIKKEYRSLIDNIVQDFYIPLLKKANVYKRAVGFFSSSSLFLFSLLLLFVFSRGNLKRNCCNGRVWRQDPTGSIPIPF